MRTSDTITTIVDSSNSWRFGHVAFLISPSTSPVKVLTPFTPFWSFFFSAHLVSKPK